MSAQDRRAEREVADFFEASVHRPDEDRGPRWPRAKRFGEGLLTGYALAKVWQLLTK